MTRLAPPLRTALLLLLAVGCSPTARVEAPASALPAVTVYKTPTCGCCGKWIEHVEEDGFAVQTVAVETTESIKAEYGVPRPLSSCHTSTVGGYVLEGHVPAVAIRKLLEERPNARGVVVPGMPVGSPGMPGAGPPYDVLLLGHDGETELFLRVQP